LPAWNVSCWAGIALKTPAEKRLLTVHRNGASPDAVGVTRERCWNYDWVLEFDIKGLFDNIDHGLLLRVVRKHVTCKWTLLYIERWLGAPMMQEGETKVERDRGTPQGGVVSSILANAFMHYAFDLWMARTFPDLPWCRYADDGLVQCRSEPEALAFKADFRPAWPRATWNCIRERSKSNRCVSR
jgi:retron-type reverse transcriptase